MFFTASVILSAICYIMIFAIMCNINNMYNKWERFGDYYNEFDNPSSLILCCGCSFPIINIFVFIYLITVYKKYWNKKYTGYTY